MVQKEVSLVASLHMKILPILDVKNKHKLNNILYLNQCRMALQLARERSPVSVSHSPSGVVK